MDVSLMESGYFLPMVIVVIVIVAVIAVVLIQRRSKKGSYPTGNTGSSSYPPRSQLDYQPKAKPMLVIQPRVAQPAVPPAPRVTAAHVPKPADIDLTSTRSDMTGSLEALVEKYSLDTFTIATADGLVFGSSGSDTAQEDAATFSQKFKDDPHGRIPGVFLLGLTHKGSDLIGIVRLNKPLSKEILQQIEADTKAILNWWI